jgi:urease accessory protein
MIERRITSVLGFASEPEWAERLHGFVHAGQVEYLVLDGEDVLRRRLRARTDRGTDCLIALPIGQALGEGAVLVLDAAGAIVVRLAAQRWLELMPRDAASALELGYFAGNLHWRVRFDGECLRVALEGPEDDYVARVKPFLDDGRARRTEGG